MAMFYYNGNDCEPMNFNNDNYRKGYALVKVEIVANKVINTYINRAARRIMVETQTIEDEWGNGTYRRDYRKLTEEDKF